MMKIKLRQERELQTYIARSTMKTRGRVEEEAKNKVRGNATDPHLSEE